jgi:hypothetical protein
MLGCLAVCATTAAAQTADQRAAIDEIYVELTQPGATPSTEAAIRARDRLAALGLDRATLDENLLARVLGAEAVLPLALGDAAGALERYEAMRARLPDRIETQRVGYLVAGAAGDGQMAEQTLKSLSGLVDSSERRSVSRMRRCMRGIGTRAPDVEIRAGDDEYDTGDRGDHTLVIHFWNVDDAVGAAGDAALATLADWARKNGTVDFVGVNADDKTRGDEARAFAKEHGYAWPQRYEGKSRQAPITQEAFHIGSPPWLVVIDSYGYLRAAGDADDPVIDYAMRASAAEASGEFARVLPTARDGTRPETLSASTAGGGKSEAKPARGERLESNPQAADKLRQARLFLRTGNKTKAKELFQEVVREWPGTQEARKAQEYLDVMP